MTRLKSTLLALALLTASPVFAQTNIAGDWDVTVVSPQGTNTTPVTFTQDGDKVSGVFKSPQGQLPFDGGKITGSDLTFTFTITMQGMQLPITLTGKDTILSSWAAEPGKCRSLLSRKNSRRLPQSMAWLRVISATSSLITTSAWC